MDFDDFMALVCTPSFREDYIRADLKAGYLKSRFNRFQASCEELIGFYTFMEKFFNSHRGRELFSESKALEYLRICQAAAHQSDCIRDTVPANIYCT